MSGRLLRTRTYPLTVNVTDLKPCKDCGTTDPNLHYRSGKMPRCKDCQNYANLVAKTTGGGVTFTREEFVQWKRAQARTCHYCGLAEVDLVHLGVVNVRTKRVMETIGVDRVDNLRNYTLDNIVLCCGPCNAIKSSILSSDDMLRLGPHIREIWVGRLNDETHTSL